MFIATALMGLSLTTAQAIAQTKPKITMIIYTKPGLPFFNPVLQGARPLRSAPASAS